MTIIGRILEKLFKLDPAQCSNCEHLKLLIEQERIERGRLIQSILDSGRSIPIPQSTLPENYKPLQSKYTPWSVVKNQLEAKDRALAEQQRKEGQILAEKEKERARIAALEKELDIPEEEKSDAGKISEAI